MEQRANSILTRLAATSSTASIKPLFPARASGSLSLTAEFVASRARATARVRVQNHVKRCRLPKVALFVDNEGPRLLIFVLPGIRQHPCLARLALHQRSRDAAFQSPRRAKWQKANRITRRRAPLRWPKSLPSLCATSGLCHRNNLSFGGTSHVAILTCYGGL